MLLGHQTIRLQQQIYYRYKNREYDRYLIIIPREAIEELGWKGGEELVHEVRGKSLILKPEP